MADGYGVLVDELQSHAGRLDTLQDRLDTALSAAREVHIGTQAFGVLCQNFAIVVHAVSTPAVNAIAEAAKTMDSAAGGMRATASSYSATEQSNTTPFTGGAR